MADPFGGAIDDWRQAAVEREESSNEFAGWY
jgi:hypothetical protein